METTEKKKRATKKKQAGDSRRALWIIVVLSVLAIGAGCVGIFCMQSHSGGSVWVYIPADASRGQVRDSLFSALGSKEGGRVYTIWRMAGGKPHTAHGAYRIDDGRTAIAVARTLKRGAQTPVKTGFNGGRKLADVARKVTANLECGEDDFLAACDKLLPEAGFKTAEFPAAFLPDTYEVYWTDSGERLVERLLAHRNRFWNDERRAKAQVLGLNPVKTATLASIVEEETAKTDERPTVARLYLNRLKKGMLLQADPTVKFATGNPRLRRITNKHLKINSPYNTYLHAGLPPGPIRVVSASTLDAVLNAPDNPYIYMCAREDFSGYHNFATDFATHSANARRYQQELNRRGIR